MASKVEKSLELNLLSLLERGSKFPEECLIRLSKKPEVQEFISRLLKANPTSLASTLERVVLSNLLVFFPIVEKIYLSTKFQHGVEVAKARQEAADAQLAMELTASEQEGERAAKRQKTGNGVNSSCKRSSGAAAGNVTANEDPLGGRENARRQSRSSGNPRASSRSRSPDKHAPLTQQASVQIETGESFRANEDPPGGRANARRQSRSSENPRASSRSRSPDMQAPLTQQASVQIETGESSRIAGLRSNDQDASNESLFVNDEDFEFGITTAAPGALARIKETWDNLGDPRDFRRRNFHCDREQDMVLNYAIKLDFFILGPMLVEHLSRRVWIMSQSDHQPSMTEFANLAINKGTPPFQRFKALKGMTCAGKHDWIQRVYGEIRLWEDVQAAVQRRSDAILSTRQKSNISDHKKILKNMAREAAEKEGYKKEKDIGRVIGQFEKHFNAGLKWRTVAEDFKGSGIIIAFIVAGTTSSTSSGENAMLT